MFSSQQLLCYVFANPDDEYRGSDLLTLDLKRYLWQSLHRQYHTVYFLTSPDDLLFSVHTIGDRDAKRYTPPKFFFKAPAPEKHFGEWLLSQLCLEPERAAAFVCPMDVFCRVLSRDAWKPVLEKIAAASQRTGIFVLTASPYAEDSQRDLLESPVFEYLHETAVTENRGRNRCVYHALRSEKPAHYLCLNTFTPERIDDLLLHICLAFPDRCLSEPERQRLAADLAAHLGSGLPLPGVPAPSQPAQYLTYGELYRLLCDKTLWERLLRTLRPPQVHAAPPPILRSPECYAGKCMKLQLPEWVFNTHDSSGKYPEDTLEDIRRILLLPANRPDHPAVAAAASRFLDRLRDLETGDIDTCLLLLDALKFCAERSPIHSQDPHYQDILDILELFTKYTSISADCFRTERFLAGREKDPFANSMERLQLLESRKKQDADKRALSECVDYLRASIVTLETSGGGNSLRELLIKAMRTYHFQTSSPENASGF